MLQRRAESLTSPIASGAHDRVLFHPCSQPMEGHDALTKASLAAGLARLLGIPYAGVARGDAPPSGSAYLVPTETLAQSEAAMLGIRDAQDLFGGVAPFPFVATKLITHPLSHPRAAAPVGWSPLFGERVAKLVLDGHSVFGAADAHIAATRLLRSGTVRVKDAGGVGGAGQTVIDDLDGLDRLLAQRSADDLLRDGLVLERNLKRVHTHSVGQVHVGRRLVSYVGHQRMAPNHHGHPVYAGSTLRVVRGGFERLLHHELPDAARTAVEQALAYHRAAMSSFPGLFASRCNYDVAQGFDDGGTWRSGVLEQSWRIGGASGAELAALQQLDDEPLLDWVDASTHEIYAEGATPPAGAQVHFDGHDPRVGRLLKYAVVDGHGPA